MAVLSRMIAVIDLGTNTFNLVVGEGNGNARRIVHQSSIGVGLGKDGIQSGEISPAAFERGLTAFAALCQRACSHGATTIKAIGTSALRNARNAPHFRESLLQQHQIDLIIINGAEEARLIWEGVRHSGALENQPQLLIDIGGGSVEFIICTDRQILWEQSIEIGMARLNELFPLSDPIEAANIANADTWLREKIQPVFDAIQRFDIHQLVGSAGSFDTLSEMDAHYKNQLYLWSHSNSWELQREDFSRLYNQLLLADHAERLALPGMQSIRANMIVYAVILIRLLADRLLTNNIICSRYALREGVLFSGI